MAETKETTGAIDLEDGEIESDGEDATVQNESHPEPAKEQAPPTHPEDSNQRREKKKKSKSNKDKNKNKEKNKKKRPEPVEDDFAGNIEKAIRKAMKNDSEEYPQEPDQERGPEDENGEHESRRRVRKRKKHTILKGNKKRKIKKEKEEEDLNDDEMMFTRGASPMRRSPTPYDYQSEDSLVSEGSYDDHRNHHPRPPKRNRPPQHFRDKKNNKNTRDRRRDNSHPMQDPDGICVYFMQGKCHKGEDCAFSHDAMPPRKMELCKFYLMDCCAKRDKCLYMHSDFPCKYYHTGLPCIYKDDCKFAHGRPLSDNLKSILLKHIESAPKEILGDFPRLSRESATMMIASTQMRLTQQFSPGAQHNSQDNRDMGMQQMFDMNNLSRPNMDETFNSGMQNYNQLINDKHSNKNTQKTRQSRWHNTNAAPNMSNIVGNPIATQDVLSIKNLTGVLTQQQIADLTNLGIESLNQLSQLTVIQLNQLGLNVKQINEIQLNTMSIQKLGLIDGGEPPKTGPTFANPVLANKDLDMRIAPAVPEVINNTNIATPDAFGHDVDMRFQATIDNTTVSDKPQDPRVNKDTIDIDQYTKDALKFASKEKENIDNMSTDYHENDDLCLEIAKTKDVDQRVLQYVKDTPVTSLSEADTDIRFLHPDNFSKRPAKRHRRSTTDDEDNNLLIDEKCYSSDEEKGCKMKSPKASPRPTTPPMRSPAASVESTAVLNKLGDLSKIDISDEITKLLNTMKNKTQDNKGKESPSQDQAKPRDPRSFPKKSPEYQKSPSIDHNKIVAVKKPPKISIYECIEGEPTDGRKRTDVDLRQLDPDFRLPAFGDTDFRQNTSSGDIDFRYGLPFKPLPNYTPATEIDGSINCHPPIPYKLKTVDIPRPDYTDIKNSTAKTQATIDPRLRKLFRLSIDESSSDSEKTTKITSVPRADPRKKPSAIENVEQQKPQILDLQNVTNNSLWYKDLSTNQKIFVNQQLATVTSLVKKHQQERPLGKKFDTSQITANPILCSVFNNLGVSVDENGELTLVNKQENLMKSPRGFNMNTDNYVGNVMEGLGMINPPPMPMGPMGNINMNQMGGFNNPFPNPEMRPAPGLLGYAPNMPHGFDSPNFGPPNFGPDGFHGNMQMNNTPGNEFMTNDYQRNANQGNFRGCGSDRWSRGNRDRRGYNDRGGGGWNERH